MDMFDNAAVFVGILFAVSMTIFVGLSDMPHLPLPAMTLVEGN